MSKKSIRKNYIYNLSYQILLLLTPLITTPYLSRVLQADGVGTVSFAESIASYFVLAATLGITTFGQREISYVQDDKEKRSLVFWETKILETITSGTVIVLYVIFALTQENKDIYFVLIFNLIAVFVDVVWFFQGLEEFGKIALRNVAIKIISILYIFLFVKSKEDVINYAFGIGFFMFISNLSLWLYLPKYVSKPQWKSVKPFRKIKAVLSLFVPTVAIQVYTVLDKTMIGLITNSAYENGYYEQALKISKMVLTIVTALGTVMIPRIGYHFGRGENDKVKNYMYRGYRFVWFLGIPLCFGLLGISSNMVPWFFGDGYEDVVPLLSILGFLVLAIGINNVTGMQYLIPTKRQNIFTLTVLIGAGTNFVLNFILIQYFQSIGAAIASVTAETVIALVQLWFVRNEFSIAKVFLSGWHYWVAGGLMLALLLYLNSLFSSSVIHTVLMVVSGITVYLTLLLIMKDEFLIDNAKKIFGKLVANKRG